MHQLDEAVFLAEFEQIFVQLEAGVILLVFLPFEEIFFLGANRPVLQTFGVVACKDELDRAEEPLIKFGLLVG
jgi:hypothetical protein